MIDFFDVIKRALNGPYYSEQDFTLKVLVPKLKAVIKKYDIRYDRMRHRRGAPDLPRLSPAAPE